jgi:sulfur relay (sulfurtransferase) complex TusBCD TusD component (DsrE family)
MGTPPRGMRRPLLLPFVSVLQQPRKKIEWQAFYFADSVFVAAAVLSPHPQLFPNLDEFLNRTSTRNAIVHHAAAGVRSVIGLTRGGKVQARQAAAKLPDFV